MGSDGACGLDRAETRLQRAMLDGDVAVLDELLDATVVFVGPDGARIDKESDLEAYRSGLLRLTTVSETSRSTSHSDDAGTTLVGLRLVGSSGDSPFAMELNYVRSWRRMEGAWRVVEARGAIADSA